MRNFDPEVINMSLDEYIAAKMPYLNAKNNRRSRTSQIENEAKNNKVEEDVTMIDDFMQKDFDNVYSQSLTEITSKNVLPPTNSSQWRIMPTNINRPPGMPPLVPSQAQKRKSLNNNMKWNMKNRNKQQTILKNNRTTSDNTDLRFQLRNGVDQRQHTINQMNSNAIKTIYEKTKNYEYGANQCSTSSMGFVNIANNEISNTVSLRSNGQQFQNQRKCLEEMFQVENTETNKTNTLAGKLLEFLTSCGQVVHKPVYDLEVHKKICILQKKTAMYTTDGGLVSADGVGVDCKITPVATDVSMNYRFG